MTDVLEFQVAQEVKGAMNGGRLKLSKQGVAFKNNKTGKVDQVHAEDMQKTNWLKVARGYELKLYTNSGSIFKYDGFKETDQERVGNFVKNHFDLELEEKEMSLKGWNWGTASFKGSELAFAVDKKAAFHLPLGNVSHSTTAKNEVILEFHQNDDAEVSLMEMRFYVPPTEADANPVEAFHEKILDKADIIQATGDALCSIEQIPCLTPRGRYDIKIFPTFLQLHGKTFDYKIPYTTVLRLFLLPHKDNRQMYFILSLDPPIVQGQTRYHFLILSFNKEDELTLELNLSEEDLEEKYQGKLQKEMNGASFEIISRLMKSLTGRKITIPGSFSALGGLKCISCSHKSNSGFLYPLERGFMYVHKPPIHLRFDEISCVNFSRGTGSTTRYFDFEIEVRNGTVFVFSSIDKNEYGPLFDHVSSKKLRVKNRGMNSKHGGPINYDELMDSDDEGDHDAYLEQMKREGKEKDDEDDEDYVMNDDSDESDEDFDPDVGEASDVELEYDSNASESSDSDEDYTAGSDGDLEEGELSEKRKKHKESKKAKKKVRTVSEKPRKRRKNKKDEDPNKPKRAPSAYMMWLNETREEIKSKLPEGSGVADVAKKGGELWNNLDTEEKANWQDKASEAKREYQKAMMEYNKRKEEEGGDESEEEQGTPKKKKKKAKKEKKTSPSPRKTTAGTGTNYKSQEFIESSESSSDDEDKPLKKKVKKEKEKKEESEKEASEKEESEKEESGKESEKEESGKEESEKEESEKEASEAENEGSGSEAGDD